ncbi:MAG: cation:proton antiporter [Candidatus Scalindua sp.]
MNTILCIGIILVVAIIAEKLVNYIKIPAITSYILLGILLGPYAFNITGEGLLASSELLSNIVLGFIAFHIGKNFSLESFKKIGKAVISISLFETAGAWIIVTAGVYFIAHHPFHEAMVFGSIAAATAPATTMMVIRQYKARGSFTEILLGIVAIDDAWGIIVFSLSISIAQIFQVGQFSELAMFLITMQAVGKIILSMILGSIIAILVSRISIYIKKSEHMLTFLLGAILINTGLALFFGFSPLLSNMFFGAVIVNIDKTAFRFFDSLSNIDWPLYVMFYVLAGANLEIGTLPALGLIGSVYIICRVIGKMGGAFVGGISVGAERNVTNYMGLALIPQAGVALGLAMMARTSLPHIGATIFSTIIATTVIYEILGPVATRYALSKAGDI